MKKCKRVNIQRLFSEEFKRKRVKEYESGEFTVREIGKLFDIKTAVIYRWIYKYSKFNKKKVIIVESQDSSTQRLRDYEKRIKELEQLVGRKQIKIELLEKMIDLAKDEFGIDLKKN